MTTDGRAPRGARTIDWASAQIRDGSLTVGLHGESHRGWSKDFGGVLALLEKSSQPWGKVSLAKGVITVAGVQEGGEEELRHFLESVAMQVNADLHLREDDGEEGRDGPRSEDDTRRAAELDMAATFRGFAQREA
jgi:hypothetical protein